MCSSDLPRVDPVAQRFLRHELPRQFVLERHLVVGHSRSLVLGSFPIDNGQRTTDNGRVVAAEYTVLGHNVECKLYVTARGGSRSCPRRLRFASRRSRPAGPNGNSSNWRLDCRAIVLSPPLSCSQIGRGRRWTSSCRSSLSIRFAVPSSAAVTRGNFATVENVEAVDDYTVQITFNQPNPEGGRCAACEGKGQVQVEMHFLSDVYVPCEDE